MAAAERGWDHVPAAVSAAAGAIAIGYARLTHARGDAPRAWFLLGLLTAAALAGYAAVRTAPRRGDAIAASGVLLILLGILGIFSIGLPVLLAGMAALAFAARHAERGTTRHSLDA